MRLLPLLLMLLLTGCSPDQPATLRKYHARIDTCSKVVALSEHTVPIDTNYLKTLTGKTVGEVLDSLNLHRVRTEYGCPALLGIYCLGHYHISLANRYQMRIYVSEYKFIDPCEQSFERWDEAEFMKETVATITIQRRPGIFFRTEE